MSQRVGQENCPLPLVKCGVSCEPKEGFFTERDQRVPNFRSDVVEHTASGRVRVGRPAYQGEHTPMDWRSQAACLTEDPELFFPIGNTGPALVQIEEAKAVCRRCDVVDTCLKWAMESGQDAGVWGGMSEDERRALKRRTARARRAG